MTRKAARKVKRGKVRMYAVMTDSASGWGSRSGIVSAFDNRGQARDEMSDLRNTDENERWWVQAGTFVPQKPRTATKAREAKRAVATVGAQRKKGTPK